MLKHQPIQSVRQLSHFHINIKTFNINSPKSDENIFISYLIVQFTLKRIPSKQNKLSQSYKDVFKATKTK